MQLHVIVAGLGKGMESIFFITLILAIIYYTYPAVACAFVRVHTRVHTFGTI